MIDVPIAVRDALKDGGYKKNYRFVIGNVIEEDVYSTETTLTNDTTYTLTRNGDYILHNDNHATGFTYILNGTSTVVSEMSVDLSGGYYVDLGTLSIGDTIRITDAYYSIDLQRKTTQKEEVFEPLFEIENDRLVKESVKIDERMCSDDTLKFGLCEGTSIEFQAFNINNITNKRIKAYVDVEYPVVTYDYDEATNKTTLYETIETYTIPMGWFDVQETSRQASTGIRKISAYNKLKSDYLDQQVNALIIEEFGTATVRILDILTFLLRKYGIKKLESSDVSRTTYGVGYSESKKYFHPYTHYRFYGNAADAFNEYPFYNNGSVPPESTKFYMEGDYHVDTYNFGQYGDDLPIQIKVDEVVPQLDTIIANYIQTELQKMDTYASRTPAQMWDDLLHMKTESYYDWGDLKAYFFYVEIHFRNNTQRIYGNTVLNADGTFEQLGRTTFTNVRAIYVVTPTGIKYGYKFDSNYYSRHLADSVCVDTQSGGLNFNGVKNFARLTGNYNDTPNDWRTTPKMPDGTDIPANIGTFFKVQVLTGGYSPAELIEVKPDELASVTLRDLQTAVFETNCQFGKLDRVNNYFTGIELNNGRLYPADTLYPDDELYPLSTSESGFKAVYSKLWADEGNIRRWRNLVITYKGFIENEDTHEHEEAEKTYTTVIDSNGTDDYEVKDNWLFKNLKWKDEDTKTWSETAGLEKIEDYATAMVNKMQSVSWFPFEMWCAGLPYVETGDEIEIHVNKEAHRSYVLRRTIKGIQNLQDEMINGTLDIF